MRWRSASRGILDDLQDCAVARRHLNHAAIRYQALLTRVIAIGGALEPGKPKLHETSRRKVETIAYFDDVIRLAFARRPVADLLLHAGILKRCRDARSFEDMEGTMHFHLMQGFRFLAVAGA